ncbi:MAG: sigma-70 family RNA polymerase sigma factor [Candidatus Binatia bacterium]
MRLADGRALAADAVVIAAGPDAVAQLLDGPVPRGWAAAATPVRAACLDVCLTRLPRLRATFALGIDQPLYLSVHSAAARLAPEGAAMIHVLKYLASGAGIPAPTSASWRRSSISSSRGGARWWSSTASCRPCWSATICPAPRRAGCAAAPTSPCRGTTASSSPATGSAARSARRRQPGQRPPRRRRGRRPAAAGAGRGMTPSAPAPAAAAAAAAGPKTGSLDHAALYRDERRFVWGLCYRMTGNAADADDLSQETFLRAIDRPPARTDAPWRPWLVRVAMNLARDLLRRRRRLGQRQPWLPSPIDTGDDAAPPAYELPAHSGSPTEGRYELLESVSFAFLLALEALTPGQRAVLLLRDVFDYSVRETADALGLSESAVKTAHHRARRAMAAYDRDRCVPTAARQARTGDALFRFMAALQADDVPAMEALLAEGVHSISEGGEYAAAHKVVRGRDRVLRLLRGLMRHLRGSGAAVRMLNGLPAVVLDFPRRGPRFAPRAVLRCDIAPDGRIAALHTVLASRKLTAV